MSLINTCLYYYQEKSGYKGRRRGESYHNLRLRILRPHSSHQLRKRRNNIRHRLVLLHDIIGPQMHRDHICRILGQPAIELILARDVDRQETGVALVVAVVLVVGAIVLGFAGADEIDALPFGGLELFPEEGAPANDFRDGVAEGHVPECGVLGGGEGDKAREGEMFEGDHGELVVKRLCVWTGKIDLVGALTL